VEGGGVNEVIDMAKKARSECLVLKVNVKKAYNSNNRNFLEYMLLGRFGRLALVKYGLVGSWPTLFVGT
jgi:hypothetical protein